MATFRPTNNYCELNFDDKFTYNLPLHEDTAAKLDKAMSKIKALSPTDKAGFDEAYNTALDILDSIFGDGAGVDIMSIFDNPGVLEVGEVMIFIIREWGEAYNAHVDRMKVTAELPAKSSKAGRR